MTRVLFVDASGKGATVALAELVEAKWRWVSVCSRPENSGTIDFLCESVSTIMTHVENSSVDGIVAGIGPGSFTGIKIGLAFAYGQAAARGAPMAGVSILQLVAERLRVTLGLVDVTLVQKATKGAGYFARAQSPGNSVVGKVKLLPQEAKFIAEDGQQLAILENSTSALYSLQEWGEFSSNLGIRGVAAKPVGHFDAESLALDSILAWLEDAWPGAFNESRVQARYVREPAPIEV